MLRRRNCRATPSDGTRPAASASPSSLTSFRSPAEGRSLSPTSSRTWTRATAARTCRCSSGWVLVLDRVPASLGITLLYRLLFLDDPGLFRRWLEELADELPDLRVICVGH